MPQPLLSANRLHELMNLVVGFAVPRAFVRRLGPGRRAALQRYALYVWNAANDNRPRKVERPRWFPKKYLGHWKG